MHNFQPLRRRLRRKVADTPSYAPLPQHDPSSMEQHLLAMETVAEVSAQVSAILELDPLLHRICALIKERFHYYHVNIYLLDDAEENLVLAAGTGPVATLLINSGYRYALNSQPQGVILRAVLQRERIISNDTVQDPGFIPNPLLPRTRAEMAVPVMLGQQLVAVLDVHSDRVGRFAAADSRLMELLATQIAIAIQNAQLFEDRRRQTEIANSLRELSYVLTSTLSLDDILDHLLIHTWWLVRYDAANFVKLDANQATMIAHVGYDKLMDTSKLRQSLPLDEHPNLARIVRRKQVFYISDTVGHPDWAGLEGYGWLRSWIGAPVIINNQVVGILNLDSRSAGAYGAKQRDILMSFADSAAIAIGNARLYEEAKREREIADTLRDIGQIITTMMHEQHILPLILEQVSRVLPYDAASVWMDYGDGQYRLVSSKGYEQFNIPPDHFISTLDAKRLRVVSTPEKPEPVVISDVREHSGWQRTPGYEWINSWAGAPIVVEKRVIGQFNLDHTEAGKYQESHKPILSALANQISAALGNALRYQAEQRRRQEIETVYRNSTALLSSLELSEVLPAIVTAATELTNTQNVHIFLHDDGVISFGAAWYNGAIQPRPYAQPLPDGPTYQAIQTGEIVSVLDMYSHPVHQAKALPQTRSLICIPLKFQETILGAMVVAHDQPHHFDATERRTLSLLANQASTAIQNAKLFKTAQQERNIAQALHEIGLRLNSMLDQDELLHAILEQAAQVLPFDAASIWLDQGDGKFRLTVSTGFENYGVLEVLQQASFDRYTTKTIRLMDQHHQPIKIANIQESDLWEPSPGDGYTASWASAPILVQGRLIGQFNIESKEPDFYNDEHIKILSALSTQISLAVANARLFESERRQRQEIEVVYNSSVNLTASLELPQVLRSILQAVLELVPAQDSYIFLYDHRHIEFGAALDRSGDSRGQVGRMTELSPQSLTYEVAELGELRIIPNLRETSDLRPLYQTWVGQVGALLSIPLKARERVVGVMNVAYKDPRQFEEAELRVMQLLARHASLAIENARLFTATQNYNMILEEEVSKRTAELAREQGQLRAIMDAMSEGVIYTEGMQVRYINQALASLTGYDEQDWIAYFRLIETGKPQDKFAQMWAEMENVIRKRGTWQSELEIRRKDGSTFVASLTSNRIAPDDASSSLGAVTVIRDISQEKALKEQKDRFIANAAHELRTPLANFKTRLYLLRQRPEMLEKHLQVMENVANQMISLVTELLDTARFERGMIQLQRQEIELQSLLASVIEMQQPEAQQKQIELQRQFHPSPLRASLDPVRITQVITNLIVNAVNYTEEGGWVRVALEKNGNRATITVQDSGIGIPAHLLAQVFQPFFRAVEGNIRGTGLGLAISKEIVEQHGGNISVESEEGKGSAFTITLGLLPEDSPDSPAPSGPESG